MKISKESILIGVLIVVAVFLLSDKKHTSDIVIKNKQYRDSLKVLKEVNRIIIIQDSLEVESISENNRLLSETIIDILDKKEITKSYEDSIIDLARQNQIK